jgi:hypothetical protein
MEYVELNEADRTTLDRQRVLQLEGDHYRLEILIREETSEEKVAQLLEQQAEIERRVWVLRGVLLTMSPTEETVTMEGTAERP